MTKNVTVEVDGHEIQTPHCIQSSQNQNQIYYSNEMVIPYTAEVFKV